MNKHAKRALTALKAGGYQPRAEMEGAVIDLIADLLHYATHKGYNLEDVDRMAKGHFFHEQKYPRGGGPL